MCQPELMLRLYPEEERVDISRSHEKTGHHLLVNTVSAFEFHRWDPLLGRFKRSIDSLFQEHIHRSMFRSLSM